ncbi:MAG: family 10 glycosylhydrolase [Ruminococcus sp.]|uniref:glycoside hydrolase family 10 protein n=1 Tax=Ruminococcus sp. TaxID=41978 RepID=UPI0025FA5F78|nr:family 10 glycosylhydrolase [Ruminococcus sp.]MBR5682768.1 family 10 glycosylhydrolase [Ruminococcus sp.]
MKKFIATACAAAFLISSGCSAVLPTENRSSAVSREAPQAAESKRGYVPMNYPKQIGMWLPYVKFPEYMQGKSGEDFRKSVAEILEDAAAESVNTVYFHVHPNGDAYFSSDIYPKGAYLDGNYDPLEIVLEEAHKRGISVHAWINPLRMQTNEQMENLPDSFIVKKWIDTGKPFVKNVNGRWYLDPAYSETVELLGGTVREIVEKYDVDGVHIDDYFYPTTSPGFDSEAFAESGASDLAAWRTENVSRFVKKLHDTVKERDKRLLFGISPQGNIRADYETQYADVRKWGSESGFCDYIVPQIYFGFENETMPFLPTLDEWVKLTEGSEVSLIIGLAAYKLGREDKWAGSSAELEWINDPDIINKQINAVKSSGADGYALYY